jgi:hypothetical protein
MINRYTSSLPVQTSFVTNADSTGDQVFTQLKREGNVALYRRDRVSTNHTFGFEVVVLKQVKAGQPLPGGNFVKADYEAYPGNSQFGRNAWFCGNESDAIAKFDQIVQTLFTEQPVDSDQNEPVGAVLVTVAEVKKNEKINWVIPMGEFTQTQFAEANGLPVRGTVYNTIQSLINKGMIKIARREKLSGGRPTVLYVGA